MKFITKPIKKGTITGAFGKKTAVLGTIVMTGALVMAATGCTTEVNADGITIESVIVSGYDMPEGADNSGAGNAANDVIAAPSVSGETEIDNQNVIPSESTEESIQGTVTPAPTSEVTATPTPAQNNNNNNNNNSSKATSFAKIPDGTVYAMDYDNGFALNESFGKVKLYPDGAKIAFVTDGAVSKADISSVTGFSDAWLIRSNGKTYIYIGVVRGCYNNELNVYEVTENSIERIGVENLIISGPSFNNTKSFWCYEYNGTDCQTDVISFERNYKVSSNGMPIPADNYSELGAWIPVWAKNEMTGYVVKDGKVTSEKYTITKGESVEPVAVNEVEYIDIKNSKNMIIRVDFTDLCCTYYDQNDYRWTYKAVMSLFDSSSASYNKDISKLNDKQVVAFSPVKNGTTWADGNFGSFYIEPYGDHQLRITYNSKSYTVQCDYTDTKDVTINKAYLTKVEGKAFILVQTILEGDLKLLNIYSVTSDSIKSASSCALAFDGEVRTPASIICYDYDHMNGVISIKNAYRLTGNGVLTPCSDEYILSSSCEVKLTERSNGQIIRNGSLVNEYKTLNKGEVVELLYTDKANYIDVLTKDQVVVRIYCKSVFDSFYNANEGDKPFEAILSMIEPA